jgi:DNA-binding CsgD family transcriptional regulator
MRKVEPANSAVSRTSRAIPQVSIEGTGRASRGAISLEGRIHEGPSGPHTAHMPVPGRTSDGDGGLRSYADARRAADPITRLQAHTLSVVLSIVPAASGAFVAVDRRLEITGAVVVQRQPAGDLWRQYIESAHVDDPLALRYAADTGAKVLTLSGLRGTGGSLPPGVGDVAVLYLRSAATVVAAVALLTTDDEAFEAHEVMQLRRLHPLLEQAYVQARDPIAQNERPDALAARLTSRELQVAQHVGTGSSNAEIAEALEVSLGTVKKHLTQIYTKLGLRSRTQLAMLLDRVD